jgi:hypothetical protein
METAYAYVDGWNYYHGINTPELHALGFTNPKKLCQHILGNHVRVERVHYFTATDSHASNLERQQFWLDALASVGVVIEERGFFRYDAAKGKPEEKTTDVRLALKIVEDARLRNHTHVLLLSADADFSPALQQVRAFRKRIKVAFPPGRGCQELRQFDPFAQAITKGDLEVALFDGEGRTAKGIPLTKALDYGWACRLGGRFTSKRC